MVPFSIGHRQVKKWHKDSDSLKKEAFYLFTVTGYKSRYWLHLLVLASSEESHYWTNILMCFVAVAACIVTMETKSWNKLLLAPLRPGGASSMICFSVSWQRVITGLLFFSLQALLPQEGTTQTGQTKLYVRSRKCRERAADE